MNPTAAVDLINKLPTGDPVMDAAKWVFLILVLAAMVTVPVMMVLNKKNKDKNENQIESAISGAGSTLYGQLVKQIEEYRGIADVAFKERNELITRVAKLEAQSEAFEQTKMIVARLRTKLDLKDQEIRSLIRQASEERNQFLAVLNAKDKEIIKRDERIEAMGKDIAQLQQRLAVDEATAMFKGSYICANCEMIKLNAPGALVSDSGVA